MLDDCISCCGRNGSMVSEMDCMWASNWKRVDNISPRKSEHFQSEFHPSHYTHHSDDSLKYHDANEVAPNCSENVCSEKVFDEGGNCEGSTIGWSGLLVCLGSSEAEELRSFRFSASKTGSGGRVAGLSDSVTSGCNCTSGCECPGTVKPRGCCGLKLEIVCI